MSIDTPTFETVDIQAGPVKRFFIEILTRDIGLSAAILDLVDNSVDSAHSMRPDADYTGLRVEIEASEDQFTISDNCAGITLDAATKYVFRLGRPDNAPGVDGSIGQFGVGMKRALFKLGSSFSVDSATADSHFSVDLDVDDWEADPDSWLIPLHNHEPGINGFPDPGTTIIVDVLNKDITGPLKTMIEDGGLAKELRSKHRMAIERGLTITLNSVPLAGTPTTLAASPDDVSKLFPLVERHDITDGEGRKVSVEIYAGVLGSSETDEDAEPEDVDHGEDDAGWYVFGNDRLLIAAEKTYLTGWGGGPHNMPLFHNQFSRFRGYVYLRSEEPAALPWNTTKTGVETGDAVWVELREHMIAAGRQVITMLNFLKYERTAINGGLEIGAESTPISDILRTAKQLTAGELVKVAQTKFTSPPPNPVLSRKSKPNTKTINYTVPLETFEAAIAVSGFSSAAELGRAAYDVYVEQLAKWAVGNE